MYTFQKMIFAFFLVLTFVIMGSLFFTEIVALLVLGVIGCIISGLTSILLLFIRATDLIESSSGAIMRSGALNRMIFAKKGHYLNESHELVKDDNYKYKFFGNEKLGSLLGGKRFYIWLLEEIHWYTWDYTKAMPDGTLVPRHEEVRNYILTGQVYTYGLRMEGRGIVTSDKSPLEIEVTLLAMITNPRKALFDVRSWYNVMISYVQEAIRDYINSHTYGDIISGAGEVADLIFEELERRKTIEELKSIGVTLLSLKFTKLQATEEYQRILTMELEGQMEAAKRVASTKSFVGMLKDQMEALGVKTTEEIQEIRMAKTDDEIKAVRLKYGKDPTKFEQDYQDAVARSKDFIDQQIAAEAPGTSGLKRYYVNGAEGLFAALIDTFTNKTRGSTNPGGGTTGSGEKEKEEKPKKKKGGTERMFDSDDEY